MAGREVITRMANGRVAGKGLIDQLAALSHRRSAQFSRAPLFMRLSSNMSVYVYEYIYILRENIRAHEYHQEEQRTRLIV